MSTLFGFSPLKTVSVVERFECILLGPTTIWVSPLASTSLFGFPSLKSFCSGEMLKTWGCKGGMLWFSQTLSSELVYVIVHRLFMAGNGRAD